MPILSPGSSLAWLMSRSIAFLPVGPLRPLLYRFCFGYSLRQARVGFGTIIEVRTFRADGASIGRFNRFYGPMSVSIGPGAEIGDRNTFSCPDWATREPGFIGTLEIGRECLLTGLHFFDVAGSVMLGDGAWIAGRGTEIWTHGAGTAANTVFIGARSYVGSGCRFAPGAAVGEGCLVAIGSVVASRIEGNDALIGGVPAKVLKQPYSWPSKRR